MIMMMEGRPAGRPDCLEEFVGEWGAGERESFGEYSQCKCSGKNIAAQIVCVRSKHVPVKTILFTKLLCTQQMCSCKGDFIHRFTAYAADMFL